jgi:hypothetical protein
VERPLLAAIEKLMNRKVEQRAIAGFEPGTRGEERSEPRREQQPRRDQQHRRPQPQMRHGHGQQQPPRRNGQQQPPRRGPQPQQRRSGRRNGNQGYVSPELEAQLQEGRARARQDGDYGLPPEPVAAKQPAAPRPAPTVTHRASRGIRRVLGSLLGGKKSETETT